MTVLHVRMLDASLEFRVDDGLHVVPVGVRTLAASISGDPPAPEDLTNAIGLVVDHLDDVERELPMTAMIDAVTVEGEGARVVVDVEVGSPATRPFILTHDAAEDVFRTLATEAAEDRRHNPGLESGRVDVIVGGAAVLVAVMRHWAFEEMIVSEADILDGLIRSQL